MDAFADGPFTGNPAGVCLLDGPRPDAWMQAVAMEMNQAETAFLVEEGEGYHLRWFTPLAEVDLCGHATLASAHVLYETGQVSADRPVSFRTRSGSLTVRGAGDGLLAMDFPARPAVPAPPPAGLLPALGVAASGFTGRSADDWLVLLEDEAAVRSVTPDHAAIRGVGARGVIVTAAPGVGADFVSRFFAPAVGVNEDPVTGSAHCTLAPFWAERLGRTILVGRQLSPRGGTVGVRVEGGRVLLSGRARTVVRGTLSA